VADGDGGVVPLEQLGHRRADNLAAAWNPYFLVNLFFGGVSDPLCLSSSSALHFL
jgi:hypothetical protein